MRRTASLFAAAVLVAAAAHAAPALFPAATQSNWSVTKGGKAIGTITLLTSPNATRAEYRASGKSAAATVFLGGESLGMGIGRSKKEAEQRAAREAFDRISERVGA